MTDKTKAIKLVGNFFCVGVFTLLLTTHRGAAESATVTWTPCSSPAVAGYQIYYGSFSHVYTNTLTVGNVSNLVVNGLVGGNKYFFAVTSRGATGTESSFSDEIIYAVPAAALVKTTNPLPTTKPISSGTQSGAPANPGASTSPTMAAKAMAVQSTAKAGTGAAKLSIATAAAPAAAGSRQNLLAAKATVSAAAKPVAPTSADTTPAVSNPVPTAPAKSVVADATPSGPNVSEAALAKMIAARAAEFYAAVTPCDASAEAELDATEKIILSDALLKAAVQTMGVKPSGFATETDAAEVVLWITALQHQIARFDLNHDGKLSATEESAVAAALQANARLLPLYAPLMLEP